jgi:AraC-like DNA-binding protein
MDTSTSTVNRMIPEGVLQTFISEYVFRELSIPSNQPVVKSMPLRVTSSLDFFLGDSYQTTHFRSKRTEPFVRCTIRGPRTYKKCFIVISGRFTVFTIRFKPTGLFRMLGIPANHFCNQAIDGKLVFTNIFDEMTDRLMGCTDLQACVQVVTPYLLKLAFRHHKAIHPSKAIDQMTALIAHNKVSANMRDLFQEACLSQRQLQRNFVKEIGTTPKLYSNMVRFENMIKHKIKFPGKSWTDLAYEFNYYDQMHLIKHFQRFLDIKPSEFLAADFAF